MHRTDQEQADENRAQKSEQIEKIIIHKQHQQLKTQKTEKLKI
jgi:hypothetical protein